VRILHVTDTYLPVLGGIELLVHDLATHQRRAGHQVTVLTATGAGLIGAGAADQDPIKDDEPPVRLPFFGDVSAILARFQPDVVHCHSSIVSPLAWRTARRAAAEGRSVLATMHSIAPNTPLLQAGLRQLARAMPRSVAWSSVSGTAAAALQPIVGGPVRVLPNGIDRLACRPANSGANQVPVIVSVMRLTRRKRPLELIAMLERLQVRLADQPWRAVIIGDGPQQAAVRRAIRRAGLADRVHLTGRLDRAQVLQRLAEADLYLAPAYLESFGIAALEARCCGLPVIAMKSGGVGEFVRDGLTGYLVGNDHDMTLRTAQLLTDRDLLRRIGQAARADPPDLDWSTVVRLSLDAYLWAGARVPEGTPAGGLGTGSEVPQNRWITMSL
jgi:glycosyltransferase involved in cell wall biosynthesis